MRSDSVLHSSTHSRFHCGQAGERARLRNESGANAARKAKRNRRAEKTHKSANLLFGQ
jgi:hypothetical protein